MKKLIVFIYFFLLIVNFTLANGPVQDWVANYTSNDLVGVKDIFIDFKGDVYVCGWKDAGTNLSDYVTYK